MKNNAELAKQLDQLRQNFNRELIEKQHTVTAEYENNANRLEAIQREIDAVKLTLDQLELDIQGSKKNTEVDPEIITLDSAISTADTHYEKSKKELADLKNKLEIHLNKMHQEKTNHKNSIENLTAKWTTEKTQLIQNYQQALQNLARSSNDIDLMLEKLEKFQPQLDKLHAEKNNAQAKYNQEENIIKKEISDYSANREKDLNQLKEQYDSSKSSYSEKEKLFSTNKQEIEDTFSQQINNIQKIYSTERDQLLKNVNPSNQRVLLESTIERISEYWVHDMDSTPSTNVNSETPSIDAGKISLEMLFIMEEPLPSPIKKIEDRFKVDLIQLKKEREKDLEALSTQHNKNMADLSAQFFYSSDAKKLIDAARPEALASWTQDQQKKLAELETQFKAKTITEKAYNATKKSIEKEKFTVKMTINFIAQKQKADYEKQRTYWDDQKFVIKEQRNVFRDMILYHHLIHGLNQDPENIHADLEMLRKEREQFRAESKIRKQQAKIRKEILGFIQKNANPVPTALQTELKKLMDEAKAKWDTEHTNWPEKFKQKKEAYEQRVKEIEDNIKADTTTNKKELENNKKILLALAKKEYQKAIIDKLKKNIWQEYIEQKFIDENRSDFLFFKRKEDWQSQFKKSSLHLIDELDKKFLEDRNQLSTGCEADYNLICNEYRNVRNSLTNINQPQEIEATPNHPALKSYKEAISIWETTKINDLKKLGEASLEPQEYNKAKQLIENSTFSKVELDDFVEQQLIVAISNINKIKQDKITSLSNKYLENRQTLYKQLLREFDSMKTTMDYHFLNNELDTEIKTALQLLQEKQSKARLGKEQLKKEKLQRLEDNLQSIQKSMTLTEISINKIEAEIIDMNEQSKQKLDNLKETHKKIMKTYEDKEQELIQSIANSQEATEQIIALQKNHNKELEKEETAYKNTIMQITEQANLLNTKDSSQAKELEKIINHQQTVVTDAQNNLNQLKTQLDNVLKKSNSGTEQNALLKKLITEKESAHQKYHALLTEQAILEDQIHYQKPIETILEQYKLEIYEKQFNEMSTTNQATAKILDETLRANPKELVQASDRPKLDRLKALLTSIKTNTYNYNNVLKVIEDYNFIKELAQRTQDAPHKFSPEQRAFGKKLYLFGLALITAAIFASLFTPALPGLLIKADLVISALSLFIGYHIRNEKKPTFFPASQEVLRQHTNNLAQQLNLAIEMNNDMERNLPLVCEG